MTVLNASEDGQFSDADLEAFGQTEDSEWPTEWRTLQELPNLNSNEPSIIECRQITEDTYQLRSATHILTLNKEGFDLYRDQSPQGIIIFEDWMTRHGISSVPRDDNE